MNKTKILLVGSGFMAREYLKVLNHLDLEVIVVGKSLERVNALNQDFPNIFCYGGGLNNFLEKNNHKFDFAINAVNVDYLKNTTNLLLKSGIKKILLEKPGDLYLEGLIELKLNADLHNANIFIAYNRRFYSSINQLLTEVKKDGGIKSVHFEFTEWVHTIFINQYSIESLNRWIIANSSHVIDTVFYLIGLPKKFNYSVCKTVDISWHPSGSLFYGSGESILGIPFTYHSNWGSSGRWGIEVLTNERRFYLRPMEKLFCQIKGSINIDEISINNQFEENFKPGIYHQIKDFLTGKEDRLLKIEDQIKSFNHYELIGGYNN